ncbi:hypothetical protein D3C80_1115200 [compost metagenome]
MAVEDRVHDDIHGPHAGDEGPFRIAAQGAVAPQAVAVVANDRGDIGVVEQVGPAGFVAVQVLDGTAGTGDTDKLLVRRRSPEAVLAVGVGKQPGDPGRCRCVDRSTGIGVPILDPWIDQKRALGTKVLGVGDSGFVGAIGAVDDGQAA